MESTKSSFFEYLDVFKEKLIDKIMSNDIVYITPHKKMDFDALASSALLYDLITSLGKLCFIVTNDLESMMEENLKDMYDSLKDGCSFINTKELELALDTCDNNLLLVVDANKDYLVPVTSHLLMFKDIVLIDHHNTDEYTIKTDTYLIDQELSSASEIVYWLYKSFGFVIRKELAQHLLTGIYLDTGLLTRNVKSETALVIADLLSIGADVRKTLDMFVISNFKDDRLREKQINDLIDQSIEIQFSGYKFVITLDKKDPFKVYTHEVLAQTADRLLKYKFDASFVIGFIDSVSLGNGHKNIISIKGRSKENFDISYFMYQFGGGGTISSGACEINGDNIENVLYKVFNTLEDIMKLECQNTDNSKSIFIKKRINA